MRQLAILPLLLLFGAALPPGVTLDSSEAEAALAIIESPGEPTAAQRAALVTGRPYVRLRAREESMKRPFTDDEFVAHLRRPELRASAAALRASLSNWTPGAIAAASIRAKAYLPKGSTLGATIFPMIKIKPNTFVFDVKTDPAIFYAIDPAEPPTKFANTLAHELHHIGIGQNCADETETETRAGRLRTWVGAFNEGLAMLAAAGGPDRHPHADSSAEERAVWDKETSRFAEYLAQQDSFFRSVLAGTAGDNGKVDAAMFAYFGAAQGPWYSVGWRMAVTIEQELGRPAAIDAFCRAGTLLATYNRAVALKARRTGHHLPQWDPGLAAALAG